MKYETNVKELENILKKLNSEKISLEESLGLYSDALIIAKDSLKELNTIKGKIDILDKQLNELELEIEDDE